MRKLTHDEFLERVQEVHGDSIVVIGQYTKMHDRIKVRHNTESCNREWYPVAQKVLQGRGCSKCVGGIRRTQEEFLTDLNNATNGNIIALDMYVNHETKMRFKHIVCGYEWYTAPRVILVQKSGCPYCNGGLKFNHEMFVEKVRQLHNDEIEVLSQYTKMIEPVTFMHKRCGNIWTTQASSVACNGSGCPCCISSKGEKLIVDILNGRGITFQHIYSFDDCRHKLPLPFDFAVFNEGILSCLIEYDGKQHFESIDLFGGEDEFELRKLRDGIKDKYCEENNLPLLRIPYWHTEEEVEQIVDQWLQQYVPNRELQLV